MCRLGLRRAAGGASGPAHAAAGLVAGGSDATSLRNRTPLDHASQVKGRVAVAPLIVGLVVVVAILFMGVMDARQPNGCSGPQGCPAHGLHIGYVIAAAVVELISVAIGVAVERSDRRSPR